MSYLVLARKYRPQQFSELVGQQHIATTLQNAFKQNKLGQAYLFTGTRGVGKTSSARIFAKALRCEHPDHQPGKKNYGSSCEKCSSCEEINAGSSLDVLEIDGASNNGVDNVREIRENVKFLPSRGRMKVYIIDEVHMLTGAAFNALLKTLEEPPAHISFILATTEAHKIPATILSRCQRFDFKRVPQPMLFEHLHQILDKEKIKAEPEAVRIIARKAEGSVRDSLSTLDQVLALCGNSLTAAAVTEALGMVGGSFLAAMAGEVLQDQPLAALNRLQKAYNSGVEMKLLATDFAESLRNALLVKLQAQTNLLDISAEEISELQNAVQQSSPEVIQAAFRVVSQSLDEISRSPMPRAAMEMLLVRLCGLHKLQTLQSISSQASGPQKNPQTSSSASAPASPSAKVSSDLKSTNTSSANPSSQFESPSTAPGYEKNWQGLVGFISKQRPALGSLLEHALPMERNSSSKEFVLQFKSSQSFYAKQAQAKPAVENLERLVSEFYQNKLAIKIEIVEEKIAATQSLAEQDQAKQLQNKENIKANFLEQSIIKDAQELFGTKVGGFDIESRKNKE